MATNGFASAAAAGTLASDSAQPSDDDAPALQSDGSPARELDTTRRLASAPLVDDPAAVEVGNELFHDPRLSASGRMSCGTCHLVAFGHADAPGVGLPLAGAPLDKPGMRSSMSAWHHNFTPPFRLSLRGTPAGGFLCDGRADDRFEQAFHDSPFFDPIKMALPGSNTSPQAVTDRVRSAATGLPCRRCL